MNVMRDVHRASPRIGRIDALLFAVSGSDREHLGVSPLREHDLDARLIIPNHDLLANSTVFELANDQARRPKPTRE